MGVVDLEWSLSFGLGWYRCLVQMDSWVHVGRLELVGKWVHAFEC